MTAKADPKIAETPASGDGPNDSQREAREAFLQRVFQNAGMDQGKIQGDQKRAIAEARRKQARNRKQIALRRKRGKAAKQSRRKNRKR